MQLLDCVIVYTNTPAASCFLVLCMHAPRALLSIVSFLNIITATTSVSAWGGREGGRVTIYIVLSYH